MDISVPELVSRFGHSYRVHRYLLVQYKTRNFMKRQLLIEFSSFNKFIKYSNLQLLFHKKVCYNIISIYYILLKGMA